ncbi:MAG: hypothetical protein AABX07_02305 [Nanoarchaeota archaeon]
MNKKADAKRIAILIVFLIFTLPFLLKIVVWSTSSAINPDPQKVAQEGANLIAEDAIPWWLNLMTWLAGGGVIGAFLIIGLIVFLKWIGEVK